MKQLLQIVKFTFRSIRQKILLSFAFFIVLPSLFIFFAFYRSSLEVVEDQIYSSRREEVQQHSREMNLLAERIVRMSNLVINDKTFTANLAAVEDGNSYVSFRNGLEIQQKLLNIRDSLLVGNAYVAVIDSKGKIYTTWSNTNFDEEYELFTKAPFYKKTIEQRGKPLWDASFIISTFFGKSQVDERLVTFTRSIDAGGGSDVSLFVGIPEEYFFHSGEEDNSFSMILEEQPGQKMKRIIWHNESMWDVEKAYQAYQNQISSQSGERNTLKLNEQVYIVNESVIPQIGWNLVRLTSQQQSMASLIQIKNQSISGLIIIFTLFTAIFVLLMFRFTGPIRTLLHSMNVLGKGDFTKKVAVKGNDEIAELGSRFNVMADRLQNLIQSLSEEQLRKEEARFQALQAQINPHFLLNTLNSIKWMSNLSGAVHVGDMITSLGELLMFNMKHDKEDVTLGNELNNLQHYMEIQKIRYHDDIVIHTMVPESLMNKQILKFTLQPIVENSIIHGGRFPLYITITAYDEGDTLEVVIQDNGIGMSEEQIKQVENAMRVPHAKFSGIGIRNISERIRMKYGNDYGVMIESGDSRGVRVIVRLPSLEESEHD